MKKHTRWQELMIIHGYTAIGQKLGLTKQRIGQIVKSGKIPKKHRSKLISLFPTEKRMIQEIKKLDKVK